MQIDPNDCWWFPGATQLSVYKEWIQSTPSDNPMSVFTIGIYSDLELDSIISFPACTPRWSAEPIRDMCLMTGYQPTDIVMFTLFIESLSDEGTVRSIFQSLSRCFPYVYRLRLAVRDRNLSVVSFSS
jgi:hypothetical protein